MTAAASANGSIEIASKASEALHVAEPTGIFVVGAGATQQSNDRRSAVFQMTGFPKLAIVRASPEVVVVHQLPWASGSAVPVRCPVVFEVVRVDFGSVTPT